MAVSCFELHQPYCGKFRCLSTQEAFQARFGRLSRVRLAAGALVVAVALRLCPLWAILQQWCRRRVGTSYRCGTAVGLAVIPSRPRRSSLPTRRIILSRCIPLKRVNSHGISAFLTSPPTCFSLGGGEGGVLCPGSPLSRPVATGDKVQAFLHCELCRRRAMPCTHASCSQAWAFARVPFGQGARLQDRHLETSSSSAGRSVLRPAAEGEETSSHSEHHHLREAPDIPADSLLACTPPSAPPRSYYLFAPRTS